MGELASDLQELEASIHELRKAGLQAHAKLRTTQRLLKRGRDEKVLEDLRQLQQSVEQIATAWSQMLEAVAMTIEDELRRRRH